MIYSQSSSSSEELHAVRPQLFQSVRNGLRGRPRKAINLQWLTNATHKSRRLSYRKISEAIGISRDTLRLYLKANDIYCRYSEISDPDLENLVRQFKLSRPNSGFHYLTGFLQEQGIRVQARQVKEALHRVDRVGRVLRYHTAISRRRYEVSGPNKLWHMDGHHKLIRWGAVIHGIIDGFDRLVSAISFERVLQRLNL